MNALKYAELSLSSRVRIIIKISWAALELLHVERHVDIKVKMTKKPGRNGNLPSWTH